MPVNTETLNSQLYDTLRSKGYDPISLDAKGDPTDEVETSDVIRFTMSDGEQNVQAWATIEGDTLVLYINDAITKSKDWESFSMFMKSWAQRKTLKFNITNKDRLVGDMKKRMVMKNKEQVLEGYHPMGKKASYNDSVPEVKIILQHTRQIEEGEQRFRNIAKIFVENINGERFLIPTNRPGLARVYARHIAEGGTPYDDKGKHITSLVEEYSKMAGFVRATRHGQFNESALVLVNEGLKHYNELRMTLQGMASHRGYNKYFESYTPMLNEEADDDTTLNELFVQETLDPRIESVMPILKRLSKNINEMSAVKELEEWAQSITEVEDETTKTLAVPADEMLDEAPGAETLKHNQNTEKSNLKAFDLAEELMEKMDPAQKAELEKLISDFEDATDPEADYYFDGDVPDTDEILNIIRQKFGDKIADTVGAGAGKMHYGRDNVDRGIDPLDPYFKSTRITKSGKLNKQDAKSLKTNIKSRLGSHHTPDLAEGPADEPVEPDMDADDKRFDDVDEGYTVTKGIDTERYQARPGLEGPFSAKNGKVVYYDKVEGKYYDPDTDMYIDYEDWQAMNEQGVVDTLKKVGKKVVDYMAPSDEELLKQLQKSAGIPKHAQHGKPRMAMPKDEIKEEDMEEGLDANQKRVGQLGPTEPVGKNEKNLRGKLVGASESVEAGEAITEMDSEGYRGSREDGDPYAKGGKATPSKSKDTATDAEKALNKSMDKAHKKDVKEGQDDLDAILRIVRK